MPVSMPVSMSVSRSLRLSPFQPFLLAFVASGVSGDAGWPRAPPTPVTCVSQDRPTLTRSHPNHRHHLTPPDCKFMFVSLVHGHQFPTGQCLIDSFLPLTSIPDKDPETKDSTAEVHA
jgi:hypothetical protein